MTLRPHLALALAISGVAFFAPSAQAQRGFARGGGRGSGRQFSGRVPVRGERRGGNLRFGWDYLPPYYFEDGPQYWPPAQPQYIPYPVPAEQPEPEPAPPSKPVEPLMMEERGGQWVRVQNGSDLPSSAPGQASSSSSSSSSQASQSAPELPSAVIVFRDGHQEEFSRYTIQGKTIYTNSDYYSTGTWTRKILLADLDVAATLKANQERGTKFTLPSSPSEVMVRF